MYLVDPEPVAGVEVERLGEIAHGVGGRKGAHQGAPIVDGQVAGRDHTVQWAPSETERKTIPELGL